MDGRDSQDGRLPAAQTVMSGEAGETTPTRDKLNDERDRMAV